MKRGIYSILFCSAALLIFWVLLFGSSQLEAFFKTANVNSTSLLDSGLKITEFYQPSVKWTEDMKAEGRKIEEGTKRKIEKDYISSYYFQFKWKESEYTQGLNDYYTKKSREKLIKLAQYQSQSDQSLNGTTISHEIKLNFYSEDGTLAVISDKVISYNQLTIDNQTPLHFYDTSAYEIMLLLEDNFWRIRHKIRVDSEPNKKPTSRVKEIEKNFPIKCVNYYPKNFPWQAMWENFEEIDFNSDFRLIKKTGFNSIRVFIPYEVFGGPKVSERHLNNLDLLLDLADQYNIKVIVTLFDFFLDYNLNKWTLSDRHLEQIANKIKNHPSLLMWDVKNEPDLDFETCNRNVVIPWLQFIINRLKTYDPTHFITIGWSQPETISLLAEEVDIVSFHFYRPLNELPEISINKPVFLEETGIHNFNAWWFPFGKSDAEQTTYIEHILKETQKRGWHYGLWTLHDFQSVPDNVVGKYPWRKLPQSRFGIFDQEGNKKDIYQVILKHNKK